ncbi:CC-NBS-LRR resistance protein [Tanacetum coccineum]
MAESLVTATAEGILKKAISLAANEFAIAWGFKESLTSLQEKLEFTRCGEAKRYRGRECVDDAAARCDEYKIVGRDKDAQHIVELLTESRKEDKLTIVPVVGMGGIGKTALAKLVFNNP